MSSGGGVGRSGRLQSLLRPDRVAALLFLALVVVYGWDSTRLTAALQVDVIGPGFFPKILAALGLVLGVILLLWPAPHESEAGKGSDLAALTPALLLLGYALAFEPVGFPVATTVFLAVSFRYLKHPGWLSAILLGAAIAAVCWALFVVALGLKLPLGVLAKVI